MKFLKQGVSLALLGAGLAAVPVSSALTATSASAAPDKSLIQQIRDTADGAVRVSKEASTGSLSFARADGGAGDLLPGVAAGNAAAATAKADDYLASYGAAFGAAKGQLVRSKVSTSPVGWTISYTQSYEGIPVFGSGLKAHVDSDGDLTSVNGFAVPDIDLATTPRISVADAGRRAVAQVKGDPATSPDGTEKADTTGVQPTASKLVVYKTGLLNGNPGDTVLAYQVEVSNKANIRDMVILDAQTGKVVNRYSMGTDALDRELKEATGAAPNPTLTTVWKEGDAFPGALNTDQQNLVNSSGESYWLYKNAFNRDSYDGAGAKRVTVNNDPRISCPNANWNGTTTNYCDGVTSDDVVAHEWGHAYTEYTSGLIYQYQPGALNESFSDVWGETVDLINGREDEGEGDLTLKRPDGQCSSHTRGDIGVTINAPSAVAGPCAGAAPAAFGPVFDKTGVTTNVVVGTDAANPTGPSTTDGCSPFSNAGAIAGAWVYIDRGTCSFAIKIANAEAAGATGILFGNNQAGVVSVAGESDLYGAMVTQADGTKIKSATGTINITVKDINTAPTANSYRWLIGEKSEAFGGAIRDMWNPTCYGDPGKVSDAEYNCDPLLTDNGGVHGNSAVPNHLYALAVDGGTSNGQTVTGMGLDKAAAIWWRAQTEYLVPSSNFSDAANAFESSCADLVGQPITKLSTATNATPVAATPVATTDCANLTKAIAAVQMRTPVTQCNYQPLLAKNTPSLCGAGFTTTTLFTEDFEDGLAGWTADFTLGTGGGKNFPWKASTTAPSHTGGVAFGTDPDEGTCVGDGSANDISSRDGITSGAIAVPAGDLVSPRLSFDHYVATEAGYDGGNLKVSVNGGAFTAVPASAYVFNAPKPLTTTDNTSPLAGQDGFTATDGGEVKGSWGTSQIDLAKLGVKGGDSLKLRFDMGRDGCGGLDGWYVDNVTMTVCKAVPPTVPPTTPPTTPPAAPVASSTKVEAPSTVRKGATFKATIKVKSATAAAGKVKIKVGGKVVGKGKIVDGKLKVTVKTGSLKLGKTTFKVVYAGSTTVAPSKDSFTVRITR